jgi:hypothetical protein
MPTTTLFIIIMIFTPALLWEAYSILTGDVITLSRAYMGLTEISPFFATALGTLLGHFAVQPPADLTLAHMLAEVEEVAVVLWLNWGVFVLGMRYDFPWYMMLVLVLVSVFVGAFVWTIGV